MDLKLEGKRCLVTGASRGIGECAAEMLAAEGCDVTVVARREDLLNALADRIEGAGHKRPHIIVADVTANDAPDTIREAACKAMGGIDVLVNSAGGSRPTKWDAPEEEWIEGMTLNFTALRRLTTGIVPVMQKNKYGRIINITGSVEPKAVNIANAAKSAVHAWAKGLSRIVGPDAITINSISPGRIKTEQIIKRHPTEEDQAAFSKENIPLGYFGEPEDLVCLIVFLASPVARYITGELFHVDGGMKYFAH
ncbi:MAG: SDR family oxidoreductase [Rhodospirillaceae bacterium]|jgi:3-oxoacyl-[acyl-carrier protein] reductase